MTANQLAIFPPEPIVTASPSTDQPTLPDGWRWVKLGEVVNKIFDGPFGSNLKTADYIDQPGYQVVRLENIGYMEFIGSKETFISEQKFVTLEKNEIYEGDIIFSSFVGDVVRTTVVPKLRNRAINKADCFCIRVNPNEVDQHFVVYALSTQETQKLISLGVHGATRPRINTTYLKNFNPLAEQLRIVSKIEELFSEIDSGIQQVETALQRLKTYRQAVLHHFLSNEGWERVKIGNFILSIVAGKSFKCEERPPINGEIGVLKVSAVSWGDYDEKESKTCLDADRIVEKYLVKPGDFLFSRANTIDLVGACVIVKNTTIPLMLSDKTLRINFDRTLLLNRFALYYLRSRVGRSEIEGLSTGNQESMRNIGQDRIKQILIAVPTDLETQTRVVQEIESRLSEADALEKTLRTELQRAERLRQSVLKQAFAGNLLKTNQP